MRFFRPGVDFGIAIFYHVFHMKKMPFPAFPVRFALLTLGGAGIEPYLHILKNKGE